MTRTTEPDREETTDRGATDEGDDGRTGRSPPEGTVGVLGGMGPAATARFFETLVDRTPAETDQEHLHVIVNSKPQIPPRTAFLVGSGEDPRPLLLDALNTLEQSGADVITVPCNTAHAFIDDLRESTAIDVLDMIRLAADRAAATVGDGSVGLLSTRGTRQSGLYHDRFAETSASLVTSDDDTQEDVSTAIEAIKAGERNQPRELLVDAVASFEDVDAIVAGCTEIPLALSQEDIEPEFVDPMVVLADRAIEYAGADRWDRTSRH